jgi:hypothetical protein
MDSAATGSFVLVSWRSAVKRYCARARHFRRLARHYGRRRDTAACATFHFVLTVDAVSSRDLGEPFPWRFVTYSGSAHRLIVSRDVDLVDDDSPSSKIHLDTDELSNADEFHWNPFNEARAAVRDRMLRAIEKELDRKLDVIEAPWKIHCFVPTPVKRHLEHFDWLVFYQIIGRSHGEIVARVRAQVVRISRQVVAKAVKETANFAGLTLRRPNPPSAPHKPRTLARIVKAQTANR